MVPGVQTNLQTAKLANWFNDHTLDCCKTYTLLNTMGKKMC